MNCCYSKNAQGQKAAPSGRGKGLKSDSGGGGGGGGWGGLNVSIIIKGSCEPTRE